MLNEFIRTNTFLYIILGCNVFILVLYIFNLFYLRKINKNYKKFMKKLGNGNNIDEMLKGYINKVEETNEKNEEIINYYNKLNKDISVCIKKIGLIRYNAFKDTGSDLSFALALLNDENDGVILNGIYSREMSNIYAKQIKNGRCNNKLSEEESRALEKAVNS